MADKTKDRVRNTWTRFLTSLKKAAEAVRDAAVIVGAVGAVVAGGIAVNKALEVAGEVDRLRSELTETNGKRQNEIEVLRGQLAAIEDRSKTTDERANSATKENATRVSANGERIARIEGSLGGTTDRVKELDATVKSNAERITVLEVVGTPELRPPP